MIAKKTSLGWLMAGLGMMLFGYAHAQTTIVVDWALDEEPDHNNHTCGYTQGGLFFPDTTGSGAGKCTLRRALREAGAISDDAFCAGCTPITIVFSGLDGTNGDADDVQFSGGQWILPVDDGPTSSAFGLYPQSITDVDGPVLLSGPAVQIQQNNVMPRVMIQSGSTLEVELSQVMISNLGFYGGMSIHAKEASISFINNTWGLAPDGLSMAFSDLANDANDLAGNHGILSTSKADDLTVAENIITGAGTFAVQASSATTGVVIRDNWIGTNINGTVPVVPDHLKCRAFNSPFNPVDPPLDNSEWFGGAGISAAGTGLLIEGNVIAGLQNIRSTNDTPPEALTVFGALHTIQHNIIGQDVNGASHGVCGQGIKFSTQTNVTTPQNNGHMVTENIIDSSRNGFENTKGALLWSDTSNQAFRDGGNTVRGNIVINGPEKYFELGPMLAADIRTFEPAVVSEVNGLNVSGGAHQSNVFGDPSPCPDCLIDFYLDDGDDHEEALQHLGSTLADGNGDFSFTLSGPLPDGFGIRTTSTAMADDVIPNTWAGQTSKMSQEVYGLVSDVIFSSGFD
jgi:hypothetical protein